MRPRNDCVRLAVAHAYGFAYDDTPTVDPMAVPHSVWDAAWRDWATARGLRWWASREWAPVGLRRWIASVDTLNSAPGGHAFHAVVMEYGHLLLDPDGQRVAVGPADVRAAKFLLPIGETPDVGAVRPITNPRTDPHPILRPARRS